MTTLAEVLNLQPTEVLLAINADTIKSGSQIVTFVILDVMKSTADLGSTGLAFNTTCRCVAVESSETYMEPLTNILHSIEISQQVARVLTMAALDSKV